jgi:aryl-alcohol dehydrogenase-like predicted oxidoreductase
VNATSTMNYRALGRTSLHISELGYGAWGIGGTQWKGGSDDESLRALHRAFELGVNFVDTALAYGDGHSEQLVGKAVKESGRHIFVATKIPPLNRVWPAQASFALADVFPSQYIVQATEESLRNLGAETIDLQQLHVWNPKWTDQDEWRRAFESLKQSGKVRYFGVSLSEHDPDSGLDLVQNGAVDALQVIYNIFDQSAAERLFPLAQEFGVGILARVPLDEGGLTGAIREDTTFADEFRAHYFRGDRPRQIVGRVDSLIADLNIRREELPGIALRFCISHPAVTSVIPGMRRATHVESNVQAVSQGQLSKETLAILHRHRWPRNFYN